MPPRPDVSEERRGQILDAAAAVFARLGVRESRMDDIVEQADLSNYKGIAGILSSQGKFSGK